MNNLNNIDLSQFTYNLPEEKIALQPLDNRSDSKLLIYNQGEIIDDKFYNLPQYIKGQSLIVLNETKVINARLNFKKSTGANIEIFCLQPHEQYKDITNALIQKGSVQWNCIIGGKKKWKNKDESILITIDESLTLFAKQIMDGDHHSLIEFKWDDDTITFAEILSKVGSIPLPPYIKRQVNTKDEERYQTIFAHKEGSVAAPTASLHITQEVLNTIENQGSKVLKVNLHVGAGTFMPIKNANIAEHNMHEEWIECTIEFLQNWKQYLQVHGNNKNLIAVGTTACRTLESLYWLGVKLKTNTPVEWSNIGLKQWECYNLPNNISLEDSIQMLIDYMEENQLKEISTKTQLLILPGYSFQAIDQLITNFHQPESTLLLLVAALVGDDFKKIYDHALTHDYRFLSYGDGSILTKK